MQTRSSSFCFFHIFEKAASVRIIGVMKTCVDDKYMFSSKCGHIHANFCDFMQFYDFGDE